MCPHVAGPGSLAPRQLLQSHLVPSDAASRRLGDWPYVISVCRVWLPQQLRASPTGAQQFSHLPRGGTVSPGPAALGAGPTCREEAQ